jgi:hypothetical protein
MFSQSFTELTNQKNFMYELFLARNQAKSTSYLPLLLLPFGGLACFVAF